jgi:hypothetical protein
MSGTVRECCSVVGEVGGAGTAAGIERVWVMR